MAHGYEKKRQLFQYQFSVAGTFICPPCISSSHRRMASMHGFALVMVTCSCERLLCERLNRLSIARSWLPISRHIVSICATESAVETVMGSRNAKCFTERDTKSADFVPRSSSCTSLDVCSTVSFDRSHKSWRIFLCCMTMLLSLWLLSSSSSSSALLRRSQTK